MFVGSTDLPPGMTLRQASRKAVVACLSDLLCKGAEALGFMVSLGVPRKMALETEMKQIASGLRDASVEYGVPIVGGDVNESLDFVVDVAMVGQSDRMVRRSGAQVGDVLVATGPFGRTALGLRHLLEGTPLPRSLLSSSLASVYEPSPKNGLCRSLIDGGCVHASMDSSDGLAVTLNELSRQSRKRFVMERLPADRAFVKAVSAAGLDPLDLVLHGGEEYEAVLCVPPAKLRRASVIAETMVSELYPFGHVADGGAGVEYASPGTRRHKVIAAEGWVHLR